MTDSLVVRLFYVTKVVTLSNSGYSLHFGGLGLPFAMDTRIISQSSYMLVPHIGALRK